MAGLFLCSFILSEFLVSEIYIDSAKYIQFGVFIEGFRMLGNLFSNASQITKKTSSLIYSNGFGAIILVIAFLLFPLNQYSIDVACFVLLFSAFSNFLVTAFLMRSLLPFVFDYFRWFMSILFFFSCIGISSFIKIPYGTFSHLMFLFCIAFVCLFFTYLLLRENAAFKRILAIELINEKQAQ